MNYYSFAQRQNPESFLNHKVKKTESLEDLTKKYKLTEKPAELIVRPRGWHLSEKHFLE